MANRIDVLGVGVSVVTLSGVAEQVRSWVEDDEHRYVCVTNVHGVVESDGDLELRDIHNRSGLTVPDGVPLLLCGRYAGARDMGLVRGPDLLPAICEVAARLGWRCFFYGAGAGTADLLGRRLASRYPGFVVAGTYSPPYRELTAEEDDAIVTLINESEAQLVWVGLSTPKQERWMADHVDRLQANVLLGVGAAFDIHAGRVRPAPKWIQGSGLEWLYRLVKEPRRLWTRYRRIIPRFIARILRRPPRIVAT